jgi:endonuclease/exonuclease/phosphatase (EEP) superfamily protein YafD
MRLPRLLIILLSFASISFALTAQTEEGTPAKLRVLAYNVACGQWATPEQIGEVLKPLNADIVLLSEVPKANRGKKAKDWSRRLADALGLGHVRVGMVSSANHKAPTWGM